MPPPSAEDIMAILGRVAGAQETFQTQLESMGNTVSELSLRVQAGLDANTATSARVQDLATELSAHQTNFYGSLARLEKTIAASPGQGTSRLTAPKLPITRLGPGHQDWLHSAYNRIAAMDPDAARLLTEPDISFDISGSTRTWHLPLHDVSDPKSVDWPHLNRLVHHCLYGASAGLARSAIDQHIKIVLADDRYTAGNSDYLPDNIGSHPDKQKQLVCLSESALIVWEALTEKNPEHADKYRAMLSSLVCRDARSLRRHLAQMNDAYDTFVGCLPSGQLKIEQPQLAEILKLSLPTEISKEVGRSQRTVSRQDRTWANTLTIINDIVEENEASRRADARFRPTARPPAAGKNQKKVDTRRAPPAQRPSARPQPGPSHQRTAPPQITFEADGDDSDEHANAAQPRRYAHDGFCAVCGKFGHRGESCREDCDKSTCAGLYKFPKHGPGCPRDPKNQKRPSDAPPARQPRPTAKQADRHTSASDEDDAAEQSWHDADAADADESYHAYPGDIVFGYDGARLSAHHDRGDAHTCAPACEKAVEDEFFDAFDSWTCKPRSYVRYARRIARLMHASDVKHAMMLDVLDRLSESQNPLSEPRDPAVPPPMECPHSRPDPEPPPEPPPPPHKPFVFTITRSGLARTFLLLMLAAFALFPTCAATPDTKSAPVPTPYALAGVIPALLRPRVHTYMPPRPPRPPPPPGWQWTSVLVDSGCTLHLIPHKALYSQRLPSNTKVRVANNAVEKVEFSGPATIHTVDEHGKPCSFILAQSHYSDRISPLLSVHALTDARCTVEISPREGYATLPDGRRIRFRREGRKDFLDFLVPTQNGDTRNTTSDAHHAFVSSCTPPRQNFVELFSGTASALQYHARMNPTAKLLAIDHIPEPKYRKIIPPSLRDNPNFTYYRCDLETLTPKKYARILQHTLNITPSCVTHCHASSPCETLSIASRGKEKHPHFTDGVPSSPLAIKHYNMLTNVLATLDAHYPHGARTILSLENPLGRFRRLPVVKATAATPGWCMFTADHCSLASTLDTDPVFPKKPTTWLCKNIPPQSEPPPRCDKQCTCLVPGTTRHRLVVCRPPTDRPLIHGQSVLPNDARKSRIPLGAFHYICTGQTAQPPEPATPAPNPSSCLHDTPENRAMAAMFDIDPSPPKATADPAAFEGGEVEVGAIPVDAQLIPPTHHINLNPLDPRILWHRRFGHARSPRLDKTSDHVLGLPKIKSPHFCECCIRAKLRKKNASRDPAARPHADRPLGEVSCDLVEFTIHKDETIQSIDGHRFAAVFVDGYSRYKFVYPMKTKDETINAVKAFVAHAGKPSLLLTDQDKVFLGNPVKQYCLDNGIGQRWSPAYRASFNGLVERSNRELKELARCMLLDSGLPPVFWSHALQSACYTTNRISGIAGPTPYELMTPVSKGDPPNVSNLRVFGSPCYSFVEKEHRRAINYHAHAEKGILLGYDSHNDNASYKVYIPARKQILSRHEVVCDESFSSGLSVLLGQYDTDLDDIAEFHAITNVNTRPRHISQNTVNRFFAPSVSLGPAKRLNDQHSRKLKNTCTSKAKYIQTRCAAIHGKSFNEAKRMIFPTSDNPKQSRNKKYTSTDLAYDLNHGHLQYIWTPISPSERTAGIANVLDAQYEHDAFASLESGDEPLTRKEAQQRQDWPEWEAAEKREWQELTDSETWRWVPKSVPRDADKQILTSKWAYKRKPDRLKARLCARGFSQRPDDIGATYAPVARLETIRTMLALATRQKWAVRALDVRNAYVQAPLRQKVYMDAPEGYRRPGMCLELSKALYGLKSSGRAWYKAYDRYLRSKGFKPSDADPCLYVHRSKQVFIMTWVDDCIIVGNPELVNATVKTIASDYGIRYLGMPDSLLGFQLHRTPDHLTLTSTKMIEQMMTRFNIPPKLVTTPLASDAPLTSFDLSETKPDSTRFRQMVGCINWVASSTRPDIAHAAHALARHLNHPSHAHMAAATRTCQYLHCTRTLGVRYHARHTHFLTGFADADWAGCHDTRLSTNGRVFHLQGGAIMWSSTRQKSIALSSAEAEVVSLSEAARDAVWLRRLHASIGMPIHHPTPMREDSSSALHWAITHPKWSASRHVATRHLKIRELTRDGTVLPSKVTTYDQHADLFTKALPHAIFVGLRQRILGMHDSNTYDLSLTPPDPHTAPCA